MEGAAKRLRPKFMTVATMFVGLIPIMWATGTGSDVWKRIAAPMAGGIFTSFVLELVVYPAIYEIWKWHFEMNAAPNRSRRARRPAVARGGAVTAIEIQSARRVHTPAIRDTVARVEPEPSVILPARDAPPRAASTMLAASARVDPDLRRIGGGWVLVQRLSCVAASADTFDGSPRGNPCRPPSTASIGETKIER